MDGGASTDPKEIPGLVEDLRKSFRSGRTRPLQWRRQQLKALLTMLDKEEERFLKAVADDFSKPRVEAWGGEVNFVAGEARYTLKHLEDWMKPTKVTTALANQPGKSRIHHEPLGTALIIAPWNYPLQLLLGPFVGAVAAGNTSVLKPSEMAPHTAATLAELVPRYLDTEAVKVVLGGVPETTALLKERFDHIFFTGNGTVGRIVMRAAAEHLTPVTLELGGKSPCIVDRSVDLEVAAKRIAWAKFYNAGQSCTSVDYVLADETIEDALVHRIEAAVREFYGDDPKSSPDFARIVNERHHQRLRGLLEEGDIVCGGETDEKSCYIAPTVIRNVTRDMKVMQEEIFGPILPIVKVRDLDEAIDFVNAGEKPLALYVFSRSQKRAKRVIRETSSGGACINECIAHMVVPELPFGGVGESGMGAYHGRASFDLFSHHKSVLIKSTKVDPAFRYPPYTDDKERWLRRLL